MRRASIVELSADEEKELRRILESPWASPEQTLGARILLRAAEGATNVAIAAETGASPRAISRWRSRYVRDHSSAVLGISRPGRLRRMDDEAVKQVIVTTLERPGGRGDRWTADGLAEVTGHSRATIQRLWHEYRIGGDQPHVFGPRSAPRLDAALTDIVGLRLDPPHGALVLGARRADTAPTPSAQPRSARRRSRPASSRGELGRYAALLASLDRTAVKRGRGAQAPNDSGFLAFLDGTRAGCPGCTLHVILDNTPAHWGEEVRAWLKRSQGVHFHFIPTGARWMIHVDSWFSLLSRREAGADVASCHLSQRIRAIGHPFTWLRALDDQLPEPCGPAPLGASPAGELAPRPKRLPG